MDKNNYFAAKIAIMHEKFDVSNMLLAVIFSAMGIAFPMLFHVVGLGSIFMPMYLPLAVGAYMLAGRNAVIMGFFTPLASAVLTGMPPFYPPIAPLMIVQLTVFCWIISWMSHHVTSITLIPLIAAIIVDRVLLACYYFLIIPLFGISAALYTGYDLIKSFPGILLMVAVIPVVVPKCVSIIRKHSLRLYEHNEQEHEHEIR